MRRIPFLFLAAIAVGMLGAGRLEAAPACQPFDPYLQTAGGHLSSSSTGAEAFESFRKSAADAARTAGQSAVADQVLDLRSGRPVPAGSEILASCVLRGYLRARYGEVMVRDLQAMVAFRTFAEEGKDNWQAPEFVRQREWLAKKAAELGLEFKSYDGRVEEITLPGPKPVLALLTHGDVQGVEGQHWASPPWEARLVGDKIIGRGTEDDKGPVVASLYTMVALRDTGWTLGSTLRLLVANAEETSWEDVPYYLERASMPDVTVAIDAAYPVTHAQKGYGILTFRAGRSAAEPKGGAWRIVEMSGGSGMSIIPERGEALIEPLAKEATAAELSRLAAAWSAAHAPARLTVSSEGKLLKLESEGRGGHTSVPDSGHNALGDLTAFLATLDLRPDAWGILARFIGTAVGTETDGRSLGIATHDEVIGDLTASLTYLLEEKGEPVAKVNTRSPRGISQEQMSRSLAEKAKAFEQKSGASIATEAALLSQAHLVPVEGELMTKLLAVWEEVTGTPGKPVAIGGGTQARLFKDGVDFGPASTMDHYRGHGTDEYLTVEELHRIAELTAAAVLRLAGVVEKPVS